MAPKLPFVVLFFLLVPATCSAAGFDVIKILSGFAEFRIFNKLLTETGLAREINRREVVTVLAPDNAAVSDLLHRGGHLPRAVLADLLAVHVVLDYLDAAKLADIALRRGGTVLTLAAPGHGGAPRRVGLLNASAGADGAIVFASATPGERRDATLKRVATTRPKNISVLQVSNFIVPPGFIPSQPPPPTPAPMVKQTSLPSSPAPAPPPPRPLPFPPPSRPEPVPNTTGAPAPSKGYSGQVIPIPSVHGGTAVTVPAVAGRPAVSWLRGFIVTVGMACMVGRF